MRQTFLVILLIFVVVLSAHFLQMNRANLKLESALRTNHTLASEADSDDNRDSEDTRPTVYDDAVAAAKE